MGDTDSEDSLFDDDVIGDPPDHGPPVFGAASNHPIGNNNQDKCRPEGAAPVRFASDFSRPTFNTQEKGELPKIFGIDSDPPKIMSGSKGDDKSDIDRAGYEATIEAKNKTIERLQTLLKRQVSNSSSGSKDSAENSRVSEYASNMDYRQKTPEGLTSPEHRQRPPSVLASSSHSNIISGGRQTSSETSNSTDAEKLAADGDKIRKLVLEVENLTEHMNTLEEKIAKLLKALEEKSKAHSVTLKLYEDHKNMFAEMEKRYYKHQDEVDNAKTHNAQLKHQVEIERHRVIETENENENLRKMELRMKDLLKEKEREVEHLKLDKDNTRRKMVEGTAKGLERLLPADDPAVQAEIRQLKDMVNLLYKELHDTASMVQRQNTIIRKMKDRQKALKAGAKNESSTLDMEQRTETGMKIHKPAEHSGFRTRSGAPSSPRGSPEIAGILPKPYSPALQTSPERTISKSHELPRDMSRSSSSTAFQAMSQSSPLSRRSQQQPQPAMTRSYLVDGESANPRGSKSSSSAPLIPVMRSSESGRSQGNATVPVYKPAQILSPSGSNIPREMSQSVPAIRRGVPPSTDPSEEDLYGATTALSTLTQNQRQSFRNNAGPFDLDSFEESVKHYDRGNPSMDTNTDSIQMVPEVPRTLHGRPTDESTTGASAYTIAVGPPTFDPMPPHLHQQSQQRPVEQSDDNNAANNVDYVCPMCSTKLPAGTQMDEFQSHVLSCMGENDDTPPQTSPMLQEPPAAPFMDSERDMVCPVCNMVFPFNTRQREFEEHVNNHFDNDFSMVQDATDGFGTR